MKKLFIIMAAALMLSACGTTSSFTKGEQYAKLYEEKPLSLLILPPINNTTNVDAKEYLYTTICRPLAEAGYYVISPMLSMDILKSESAYDAELFVEGPIVKFKQYFGADAVVFTQIENWKKGPAVVNAKIRLFIRSTTSGDILFDRTCDLTIDLSENTFSTENSALGALLNLAVAALKTATTDHVEAGRAANYFILSDMPRGKYDPEYQMDQTKPAAKKEIAERIKR